MRNADILTNFRTQIRTVNPRFTQKRSSLDTMLKALDKRIQDGTDDEDAALDDIRTAIQKNDQRIQKYKPYLYRLLNSWGNNSLSYLDEGDKRNFSMLAALDPHLCYIKRKEASAVRTQSYIKRFAFERAREPRKMLSQIDRGNILDIGLLNLSKLMWPGPANGFCSQSPIRKLVRDLAALNNDDISQWLPFLGFIVFNASLIDFQRNPPQPLEEDDEPTKLEKRQRIDDLEIFSLFFKPSVTQGNIYDDIGFNTCHDTAKGLLKLFTTNTVDHCQLDKGNHAGNIDNAIAGLNNLLTDDNFIGKVIHIDIHDHSFSLWPHAIVDEGDTDYERVESWAGQRWAQGIDAQFVPSLSLMDCLARDDNNRKCTQAQVKTLLQALVSGLQRIKTGLGNREMIQFSNYSYFMGNGQEAADRAILSHNFYLQSATPKTHDQMLETLQTCIGHANYIISH
ncbi:hypothetical protein [Vibrio mangrovi]|uniref:Uncharacterized protein n=1 Tax=Vibrio mangrovi TaxID=474394 RepID=A0A1Y6IYM3_9VIBR|nr:hypothetical protein [Vibrio mangrovi]MDW6004852.1 hypothetical protein [Vibrio mangrovi]SMS01143.1 hypothetical protein VIM7927_02420 [Vibrio mangrovi]